MINAKIQSLVDYVFSHNAELHARDKAVLSAVEATSMEIVNEFNEIRNDCRSDHEFQAVLNKLIKQNPTFISDYALIARYGHPVFSLINSDLPYKDLEPKLFAILLSNPQYFDDSDFIDYALHKVVLRDVGKRTTQERHEDTKKLMALLCKSHESQLFLEDAAGLTPIELAIHHGKYDLAEQMMKSLDEMNPKYESLVRKIYDRVQKVDDVSESLAKAAKKAYVKTVLEEAVTKDRASILAQLASPGAPRFVSLNQLLVLSRDEIEAITNLKPQYYRSDAANLVNKHLRDQGDELNKVILKFANSKDINALKADLKHCWVHGVYQLDSYQGYTNTTATRDAIKMLLMADVSDLDAYKVFLDAGVSPNFKNQDGTSNIMCALHEGHFEVAQLLVDYGANVNDIQYGGRIIYGIWGLKTSNPDRFISILEFAIKNGLDLGASNILASTDLDAQSFTRILKAGFESDNATFYSNLNQIDPQYLPIVEKFLLNGVNTFDELKLLSQQNDAAAVKTAAKFLEKQIKEKSIYTDVREIALKHKFKLDDVLKFNKSKSSNLTKQAIDDLKKELSELEKIVKQKEADVLKFAQLKSEDLTAQENDVLEMALSKRDEIVKQKEEEVMKFVIKYNVTRLTQQDIDQYKLHPALSSRIIQCAEKLAIAQREHAFYKKNASSKKNTIEQIKSLECIDKILTKCPTFLSRKKSLLVKLLLNALISNDIALAAKLKRLSCLSIAELVAEYEKIAVDKVYQIIDFKSLDVLQDQLGYTLKDVIAYAIESKNDELFEKCIGANEQATEQLQEQKFLITALKAMNREAFEHIYEDRLLPSNNKLLTIYPELSDPHTYIALIWMMFEIKEYQKGYDLYNMINSLPITNRDDIIKDPIHFLVKLNVRDAEAYKIFLKNGAQLDVIRRGSKPLELALEEGQFEVAQRLIDSGAKLSDITTHNNTRFTSKIYNLKESNLGRYVSMLEFAVLNGLDCTRINILGDRDLDANAFLKIISAAFKSTNYSVLMNLDALTDQTAIDQYFVMPAIKADRLEKYQHLQSVIDLGSLNVNAKRTLVLNAMFTAAIYSESKHAKQFRTHLQLATVDAVVAEHQNIIASGNAQFQQNLCDLNSLDFLRTQLGFSLQEVAEYAIKTNNKDLFEECEDVIEKNTHNEKIDLNALCITAAASRNLPAFDSFYKKLTQTERQRVLATFVVAQDQQFILNAMFAAAITPQNKYAIEFRTHLQLTTIEAVVAEHQNIIASGNAQFQQNLCDLNSLDFLRTQLGFSLQEVTDYAIKTNNKDLFEECEDVIEKNTHKEKIDFNALCITAAASKNLPAFDFLYNKMSKADKIALLSNLIAQPNITTYINAISLLLEIDKPKAAKSLYDKAPQSFTAQLTASGNSKFDSLLLDGQASVEHILSLVIETDPSADTKVLALKNQLRKIAVIREMLEESQTAANLGVSKDLLKHYNKIKAQNDHSLLELSLASSTAIHSVARLVPHTIKEYHAHRAQFGVGGIAYINAFFEYIYDLFAKSKAEADRLYKVRKGMTAAFSQYEEFERQFEDALASKLMHYSPTTPLSIEANGMLNKIDLNKMLSQKDYFSQTTLTGGEKFVGIFTGGLKNAQCHKIAKCIMNEHLYNNMQYKKNYVAAAAA